MRVGINFNPSPKSWDAAAGSDEPSVRSWKPFSIVCQFPAFPAESMPVQHTFPRSQTGLLVGLLVDPMVQEKVCQEFEVNLFLAYFFGATAYVRSIDSYVDDMGH